MVNLSLLQEMQITQTHDLQRLTETKNARLQALYGHSEARAGTPMDRTIVAREMVLLNSACGWVDEKRPKISYAITQQHSN